MNMNKYDTSEGVREWWENEYDKSLNDSSVQGECMIPGCTRKQHNAGYGRFRPICYFHHNLKNQLTYRTYLKNYCENIDGRLGFICKNEILYTCQLQVDHIDGNRDNDDPKNLQTLCANCHSVKTQIQLEHEVVRIRK